MDYELFIKNNTEIQQLGQTLFAIMTDITGNKAKFERVQHKLGYQYIYIESNYLSIDIDLNDEDDEMKEYQDINFKYYKLDTDTKINIQLYSQKFNEGWLKLIELVGRISNTNQGDLLLLDDRSFPLIKKRDGMIFINTNLDDDQVNNFTGEKLKLLNHPYIKENFTVIL
ncbi:hypothetical protein ACN9MH_05050 [Paenibacillus silvae]|jgi:hypothetical protein|uniref:hypothetical protein n=1 Tax=Paenibacillus silvae TaxID=1325358 RepID=UPI0025A1C5D6|nr:hypothetical protein [Paenibacillus silvae]MDM5279684.1 hypothetical protein [Paenibacillus silvae]